MENSAGRIRLAEDTTSLYEQIKDNIEITTSGSNNNYDLAKVAGTYMPRYLLDYVIMTCDISYYKLIHELMDTIDQVADKYQRNFVSQLQLEIESHKNMLIEKDTLIADLRASNARIEAQNNELKETIDELYNMNLSSGVTIRSMDKKLTDVRTAVGEVHNEVSTIKVKDKKLHRTRDVLILYTSPDKPRDHRLRENIPECYTWIYRYGNNGTKFGKLDLEILRTSRFTSELETRINYE